MPNNLPYKKGDVVFFTRIDTYGNTVRQRAEVLETCQKPRAVKVRWLYRPSDVNGMRTWLAADEVATNL